jgi:predicted O-methyltransferase YrrM
VTITDMVALAFGVGVYQHQEELEGLVGHLLTQPRRFHALEIGTLHGGTAALWGQLYAGRIVTVDLPEGPFGGAFFGYTPERCEIRRRALAELNPRILSLLGDSHDPLMVETVRVAFGGDQIDMLFLDGDHSLAGVREDFARYRPLVRPGGVVVFHDINDTPKHALDGCEVPSFWRALSGRKIEITIGAEWGGIGVLHV